MLSQRRRRSDNIKTISGERLVFAGPYVAFLPGAPPYTQQNYMTCWNVTKFVPFFWHKKIFLINPVFYEKNI